MSTHANDGGPAFPSDTHVGWTEQGAPIRAPGDPGMSLRDFFAASALQALIQKTPIMSTDTVGALITEAEALRIHTALATGAYDYADAMLRAREASNG